MPLCRGTESVVIKTNAIRILEMAGIPFVLHEYPADEETLSAVAVARHIGMEPERVFKTLVAVSDDGANAVFCIPGNAQLELKKAAKAAGAKRITMVAQRELKSLTGYIHGGCSPVGMKRGFPTFFDESIELHESVCVSAGVRGENLEIAPGKLVAFLLATLWDLTV
ncbi:MAG: Cys-tRNA(Pro) deacylase [Spirochaetales bacterium]|nr:MAG: Cys-tRNA(Pro) deacylase [Spirochaetales bacterium]